MRVAFLVLSFTLCVSCKPKNYSEMTATVSTAGATSKGVASVTPQQAQKLWTDTPEGLSLITDNGEFRPPDDFDPSKRSIIFVHGWQNRKFLLPQFINRQGWKKRFNTFIFRWHKRAFDPGTTCVFPMKVLQNTPLKGFQNLKIYPDGCPKEAEQKIWHGGNSSGEFFVSQYRKFFENFPSYKKEIWTLAVSLGTQVATYGTYKIWASKWKGPKPVRLELIDPYIGMKVLADTGQMPVNTLFPFPEDAGLPDWNLGIRGCTKKTAGTKIICVMENSLYKLKKIYKVATVAHLTATGIRLSSPLGGRFHLFMPVQSYSKNWLCPPDTKSGVRDFFSADLSAKCSWMVRDSPLEVGTGMHNGAIWAWFWSIGESSIDSGVVTAKTSVGKIRQWGAKIIRLSARNNWCQFPEGWNWTSVFRRVFLGERPDGTLEDRLDTREQLLERLKKHIGMSQGLADQCVEAISLANDRSS